MTNVQLLEPKQVRLERTDDQEITLKTDRTEAHHIRVKRAFPLTDPDEFVIVSDASEHFVGLLEKYKTMDSTSRHIIEEELDKGYFVPRIVRVDEIRDKFGTLVWSVQTDRGAHVFELKSPREDIRWLGEHHLIIRDVDGNRYEILDVRRLEEKSRDRLEMEL